MCDFVIWTRYIRSSGKIVRHVYGPYETRGQATKDRNDMMKRAKDDGEDMTKIETVITRLIK
jgi:hypothetical protein